MRNVIRMQLLVTPGVVLSLMLSGHASQDLQEPAFRAGTTLVTVDVIVRDSRERPVTHLTEDDFAILEDGVPQAITSFRAPSVTAGSVPDPATGAATTQSPPSPTAAPGTVALVFDRLNGQPRAMVLEATLTSLGREPTLPDATTVYLLDQRLEVLQPLTRDRERVIRAVEQAATRAPWQGARRLLPGSFEGEAEESLARAAGVQGEKDPFFKIERDQRGFAVMEQLRALVASLAHGPGRKHVVLFSEGLPLSVAIEPHFEALIGEANRANVAFYGIDAACVPSALSA